MQISKSGTAWYQAAWYQAAAWLIRQLPDQNQAAAWSKSGSCLIDQDPGLWDVYRVVANTEGSSLASKLSTAIS